MIDVPIYVHELELKHAFFCIANKSDLGVYLPSYGKSSLLTNLVSGWERFHLVTVIYVSLFDPSC